MADHEEVEQDLSHIHWSWPEAIAANPARSLATPDLAMDYFAFSPFWDSKSNNNVLRTQRRVENPTYGHAQEKIELQAFKTGFEYIVAHSLPPDLFVIHRRDVDGDAVRDKVTAIYFILEGKIYPTPTLYDVMASRLTNATHLISKTFARLSAAHPPANPRMTSQWRALPPSTPSNPQTTAAPDSSVISSTNEKGAAPTPAETPAAIENEQSKSTEKATTASEPDWKLFHTLNTTRTALTDLDEMSTSPEPAPDPLAELRAIEGRLLTAPSAASVISQKIGQGIHAATTRSAGSVIGSVNNGFRGVSMGAGLIPGIMVGGTPRPGASGKAASVLSGYGPSGSPLANGWSAGQ